jgi:serine/threonine protein kinase
MCAVIMKQILEGMDFFHRMSISHRDIKLENILIDMEDEQLVTKIIDFGFAHHTEDPNMKLTAFCGTPGYMSPQMAMKKDYLGPPVDIWAAGIVLYTILFGFQPFKSNNEVELLKKIAKGTVSYPKSSHPDFANSGQEFASVPVSVDPTPTTPNR